MKTSITLSSDLMGMLDTIMTDEKRRSRSDLIEEAVRRYIEQKMRVLRDRRELRLINKQADRLNREAEDVLSYQVDW